MKICFSLIDLGEILREDGGFLLPVELTFFAAREVTSSVQGLDLSTCQSVLSSADIGKEDAFLSSKYNLMLSIVCLGHRDNITTGLA